jgi:DnaJ like chaperone protein
VSEQELGAARQIMSRMMLDREQTLTAMRLFSEGKGADFDLDRVLDQFYRECGRQKNLLQMFMEIQIATALADGTLHPQERSILLRIARHLHFSPQQFERLLAQVLAQRQFRQEDHASSKTSAHQLRDAHQILGVREDCSDAELKQAYRRLISQHHPDKLVSKGLPEEMMRLATEKTREIKDAYELIKAHRETN